MCRVTINAILDSEEIFVDQLNCIERELVRMNKYLVCPECKENLSLRIQTNGSAQYFECANGHKFNVEDGVVFFNTREIPGELWSLWLRNYEHYLQEATHPGNPRYLQGETPCKEVMWREIEKLRPSTIVDIACGTGSGIKYIIERINWRCTVILTDLSFRILTWNRKYFTETMRNPYVDLVFLACDCSNIPLHDSSVDMVFSNGGFESMQNKMMAGFNDAHRILKPGGKAVYNMSLVDDSDNTKKWIELYLSLPDLPHNIRDKMKDASEWLAACKSAGFSKNKATKIYSELPAPDTEIFISEK